MSERIKGLLHDVPAAAGGPPVASGWSPRRW
jgi:hypothetical protein